MKYITLTIFVIMVIHFYSFVAAPCLTDSGTPNVPCVFPFTFRDKVHNACTWVTEENNRPWCATKVDSEGDLAGHDDWGFCGPQCPMEDNGDDF